MSTIQEQLQRKRFPIDKWDIKEKLLLASAVVRSGDQNWMSVSRVLKTYGHGNRPSDWYSQKNCAAQYGLLLENVETPKRKKRTTTGAEAALETPSESILRRLRDERMIELKQIMIEQRKQYMKLKEEIELVKSGRASETELREMCLEIEQENKQKEYEAQLHAEFLKNREERKLELERQWRPYLGGQKRKHCDIETEKVETASDDIQDNKPAMAPLLTSLLKSPSPAPTATSSILHSAITNNQRTTPPTIASLLNSSPEVNVSPGLQQLVSTAISQEPAPNVMMAGLNLLTNSSDIKKEPLTSSSILSSDNIDEEMQLIEEVIKNVEENESKKLLEPENVSFHHESDQNKIGEIKNELDKTLGEAPADKVAEVLSTITEQIKEPVKDIMKESAIEKVSEAPTPVVSAPIIRDIQVVLQDIDAPQNTITSQNMEIKNEKIIEPIIEELEKDDDNEPKIDDREESTTESTITEETTSQTSVEEISEENIKKESNKEEDSKQEIEIKQEIKEEKTDEIDDLTKSLTDESDFDESSTPLVKTEKVKRDYSRNKKKDDNIDFFDVDKLELTNDEDKDILEDLVDGDKKCDINKLKSKNFEPDRSDSPWIEEDEMTRNKRRYSTPATPASDSVPNSPASSLAGFEDDKEFRAWKKSIMLVYNRMATHRNASLFLRPITDEQAPGYHSIIREPKDLQTLRRNIDNGQIKTTQEFIRYILLMFQNAVMYNKTNDFIYNMAREMQSECFEQIQILVQAQAQIETPTRRETRTSEPGLKHKTDLTLSAKSRKRKLE